MRSSCLAVLAIIGSAHVGGAQTARVHRFRLMPVSSAQTDTVVTTASRALMQSLFATDSTIVLSGTRARSGVYAVRVGSTKTASVDTVIAHAQILNVLLQVVAADSIRTR